MSLDPRMEMTQMSVGDFRPFGRPRLLGAPPSSFPSSSSGNLFAHSRRHQPPLPPFLRPKPTPTRLYPSSSVPIYREEEKRRRKGRIEDPARTKVQPIVQQKYRDHPVL